MTFAPAVPGLRLEDRRICQCETLEASRNPSRVRDTADGAGMPRQLPVQQDYEYATCHEYSS